MCFDYDVSPEFWSTHAAKARKPHRCEACGDSIQAGDTYQRQAGKCDGYFHSFAVCRRCCYDVVRVVEHELAEGCFWQEAWPSIDDLLTYLHQSEMGQTPRDAVPESFSVGDMPRQVVAK
jgi:hypothetical protein